MIFLLWPSVLHCRTLLAKWTIALETWETLEHANDFVRRKNC
jgi:hypothetical protein